MVRLVGIHGFVFFPMIGARGVHVSLLRSVFSCSLSCSSCNGCAFVLLSLCISTRLCISFRISFCSSGSRCSWSALPRNYWISYPARRPFFDFSVSGDFEFYGDLHGSVI